MLLPLVPLECGGYRRLLRSTCEMKRACEPEGYHVCGETNYRLTHACTEDCLKPFDPPICHFLLFELLLTHSNNTREEQSVGRYSFCAMCVHNKDVHAFLKRNDAMQRRTLNRLTLEETESGEGIHTAFPFWA